MADKTYEIEIKTTSDTEGVTSVKDALQETQSEADATRDALEQAFSDATSEVERLEDALADTELNGDDLEADIIADELADARDKAEELSDALNSIDSSGIDNTTESVDGLKDSLQQTSDSAGDVGANLELLDSAIMMDMSNQIGQLGSNAEGMAQDMNNASISVGQLSKNVGMAEPQMVSLINNISNKTFPQEEALAYVNALNQMGVSADKLGDSATNMDRINDATHIGSQKVMQLTAGLQSMGISADNLPASFNAIAYAEANVYDGTNTLSQVLKTQAGTINEYGLNVDQLAVVLGTLQSQTGLTGRKLSSELGSRLKDCNGDIGALEQSLGLANGTLQNASDLTGQYSGALQNLADEEMEHKSILDEINAGWEDMQLSLSPILSPLSSFMGLIGQAGMWAVGVNGLISLATTMRDAEIAQWALNLAMSMNPIMLLVIAIGILIGALVYLYFNNEQVRQAIDGLGQSLYEVGTIIYSYLLQAWDLFIQTLQNVWNYIVTLGGLLPANVSMTGNQIIDTVLRVLMFIGTLPAQIGIIFINIIAKALGFGNNFAQRMITAGTNAVSQFMNSISQLPSRLMAELNQMLSLVGQWASTLPQKFWEAGVNAVKNFLSALGIASPGTMQRTLVWEITEMGKRVPYESRNLLSNVNELGQDIVDEFGNPTLDFETGNGHITSKNQGNRNGGSATYNFYFNDTVIDNEERMEKICDYITKKLTWNNTTAGRTI